MPGDFRPEQWTGLTGPPPAGRHNGHRVATLPAPPPVGPVDDTVVRTLHEQAAALLAAQYRDGDGRTAADRRAAGADIAARVVRQHLRRLEDSSGQPTDVRLEAQLVDAVIAYLFGLGRLQALADDPDVENIMVLGHDRVRIEYADGRVALGPPAAGSDAELVDIVQRVAAAGLNERALTTTKPTLNLRLDNGSRLAAMHLVTPYPVVVIRRHRARQVDLDDMVRLGAIDPILAAFLAAVVRANLNVIIAGPANSGKTTLMRAMASAVDRGEWFATMETEYELGLHESGDHDWVVPIEAREGHGEIGADGRPAGEVPLERIFPDTLRLSATRLWVGEVRSHEIVPMFDAMHTMRGSVCTLHARHSDTVLTRLAELLLRYGAATSLPGAWLTVVNALDYIIYLDMINEMPIGGRRHRYVSHVVEITGLGDGAQPATQPVFGPGPDGRAVPAVPPHRTRDALRRAGFDLSLLTRRDGAWPAPLNILAPGWAA